MTRRAVGLFVGTQIIVWVAPVLIPAPPATRCATPTYELGRPSVAYLVDHGGIDHPC